MSTYFSDLAPTNLPRVKYATVDDDQAGHISEAMTHPENQKKYDISFIPIDTPEARRIAAEEWSKYKRALGNIAAKEQGAFMVVSSRNDSPEALERLLDERINAIGSTTHALAKVTLKDPDANIYDLMRSYYEPTSEIEGA